MSATPGKLTVHIGESGAEVGTLFYERRAGREASSFRYALSWLENPSAFAISPTMPLGNSIFRGHPTGARTYPFPSPIADACPDSWGREVARLDHPRERGPITSLDYLLGIEDRVRLGALRFSGDDGEYIQPAAVGVATSAITLQLKDLALSARAIEAKTASSNDIRRLRGVGSALGGARPKATVVDQQGNLFIAKFSARGEALATEKMEVVTQRLAASVGINACEAAIVTNKDFDPVALISRFDRTKDRKRIPYISARTMLDAESGVGATYTEIAYAIRQNGFGPASQLRELFRRVAFTILVSNVDDHLLNHGFLHVGGGKWALAPMFDVNPAPERASSLKTAISEVSGNEASIDALMDACGEFDMQAKEAAELISTMSETISAGWRDLGARLGMTTVELKAFTDAFVHEEARKAAALAAPKAAVRTPVADPGDVEPT